MRTKSLTWGDIGQYAEAHGTALSGLAINILMKSEDHVTGRFSYKLHNQEVKKLEANVRDWIAQGRPAVEPFADFVPPTPEELRQFADHIRKILSNATVKH